MKTFLDLVFNNNDSYFNRARISDFGNGYGVSVVYGKGAYGDSKIPFEVAVLKDNDLCYDTHLTDDVIGYCDVEDVNTLMKQIQEL